MESLKNIIKGSSSFVEEIKDRHKYVTKEYQDFGYRIAKKLGQEDQISLYIKIAKNKPRALVETAFSFAVDYPNARNRGKLFMWKLHDLEKEYKKEKLTLEGDKIPTIKEKVVIEKEKIIRKKKSTIKKDVLVSKKEEYNKKKLSN